jgi:hypothetical protein
VTQANARRFSRNDWLWPLLALAAVLLVLLVLDRQQVRELEADRREARSLAERRAARLGDQVGNVLANRLGSLRTVKLQFTVVGDSISDLAFLAAADSVTREAAGLAAISLILPDSTVQRGQGAGLGTRGAQPFRDTLVSSAYGRAVATQQVAATSVLDLVVGRRVMVFDPVVTPDSAETLAVVVGELDPGAILRVAREQITADTLRDAFFSMSGPRASPSPSCRFPAAGSRPTTPCAWPTPSGGCSSPTSRRTWARTTRAAWCSGRWGWRRGCCSREARELAAQLEAAQRRRSGSPPRWTPRTSWSSSSAASARSCIGADVASLYTFDEEGEVLIGRKRIVFRDVPGGARSACARRTCGRSARPVAMLPGLAEAVATGEPHSTAAPARAAPPPRRGRESPTAR